MKSKESIAVDGAAPARRPSSDEGLALDVDRGPDCLVVRIRTAREAVLPPDAVAESIWEMLERHLVYRLVLDLDGLQLLHSRLLGQLLALRRRIAEHRGSLRLCGLSPSNVRVLHVHKLQDRLPHYATRRDAMMR